MVFKTEKPIFTGTRESADALTIAPAPSPLISLSWPDEGNSKSYGLEKEFFSTQVLHA